MVRTVISVSEEDKEWLDRTARERRVSLAEVVRTAVRHLREEVERDGTTWDQVLAETHGLWKRGDGLEWQNRLREEWGT